LHDLENPEKSIVAIENGSVSGRGPGGPLTDMLLKVMHDGDQKPFMTNYRATIKDGKTCRSSSFFIRDDETHKMLGVLCINTDISAALDLHRQLCSFLTFDPGLYEPVLGCEDDFIVSDLPEVAEHLHETLDDVLHAMINKVLACYPVAPENMGPSDKAEIIRRLNDTGLFMLKGGVSEAAKRIGISEASVYRYISKAKADQTSA